MLSNQCDQTLTVAAVTDHLFRHEYGRLVSYAAKLLGPSRIDLAEDIVSESLMRALKTWPNRGVPNDPAAWLFAVTRNQVISHVRSAEQRYRDQSIEPDAIPAADQATIDATYAQELDEATLAMMFACAHPSISSDAQVALMLKELCGFSAVEIAAAYLESESTIAQRLVRAKATFRNKQLSLELPPPAALAERRSSVLRALYLLFNEGYYRHGGELLVDTTQCHEAIRLTALVARHPKVGNAEVAAALALFCFHAARLPARVNQLGELLLLEEQDRSVWDTKLISDGYHWLRLARSGSSLSRYHLEAGIASCHVTATSNEEIDWKQILLYYNDLMRIDDSPIVRLNRAVAIGKAGTPREGLDALTDPQLQTALTNYLPWHASRAAFAAQCADHEVARQSYQSALLLAQNEPQRKFIQSKLDELNR